MGDVYATLRDGSDQSCCRSMKRTRNTLMPRVDTEVAHDDADQRFVCCEHFFFAAEFVAKAPELSASRPDKEYSHCVRNFVRLLLGFSLSIPYTVSMGRSLLPGRTYPETYPRNVGMSPDAMVKG